MNYYTMIDFHRQKDSDLTVGVVELEKSKVSSLGVVEVDASGRVQGFQEKPRQPKTLPQDPEKVYASMGIYVFKREALEEELTEDAHSDSSEHDFGKNILPHMIKKGYRVFGMFRRTSTPNFWRLQELNIFDKVNLIPADLIDSASITEAITVADPD
jgi:glucose-1-phosphate adenylyltransferase